MGAIQCKTLSRYYDHDNLPCMICHCVEEIRNVKDIKNAPLSLFWRLTFRQGTQFEGKELNSGLLKITPKYTELARWIEREYKQKKPIPNWTEWVGVEYESKVYRGIIVPLRTESVCNNFVTYMGSSGQCKADDLAICVSKTSRKERRFLVARIEKNVDILIHKATVHQPIEIPEITANIEYDRVTTAPLDELRYNVLLFEDVNRLRTFDQWFTSKGTTNEDRWQGLFQVGYSCLCMSASQLIHNDMDLNNIYVKDFSRGERVGYIVEETYFNIPKKNWMMIFNFSNAYSKRIGLNQKLEYNKDCQDFAKCNKYIENLDIIRFLGNVYRASGDDDYKNKLLDLIVPETYLPPLAVRVKTLIQILFDSGNLLNPDDKTPLPEAFYTLCNNTENILRGIGAQLYNISPNYVKPLGKVGRVLDETYIFQRSMFTPNGNLVEAPIPSAESILTTKKYRGAFWYNR